jgi:hypothetical protein
VIALLNDPIIRAELVSAFGNAVFAVLGLSLAYAVVSLVRHCRKRP